MAKVILYGSDRMLIIRTLNFHGFNMIFLKLKIKAISQFFLPVLVFGFWPNLAMAQEFNCEISINTEQLEGTSFDYINEIIPQLQNYINEFSWTDTEFREEERIECKIQLIFTSANSDFVFSAEAIFQAQRPVFNTMAKTTTILLSDDTWQFTYREGQNLIHDELQFEPLTGFIDFYMNIILGYDFDSFSEHGGDPYFQRALNILNLAQASSAVGWTRATNNRRNRNVLVTDLNSNNYDALRSAYYRYHRLGLDQFVTKPDEARTEILEALKTIRDAKRRSTNNYLYDLFFDTKAREIAAVFTEAETEIRLEAYNVLRETDQGHLTQYESLQN